MPTAKLISITPDCMELLKTACSQPYGNKVTTEGVKKILESGHLSVLEHCSASFLVTCSVRVLGQLTRHRHLSFTVKSSRGSVFMAVATPNIKGKFNYFDGWDEDYYYTDKQERIAEQAIALYDEAIDNGMSFEDAAYLLPQGAITSMVITGNFRTWYEYLPKRLCKRALAEHRELANLIHLELAKACPEVFERTFMNCSNCKERSCQFK